MSVCVCIPSARPIEHVRRWSEAWRDMGYKVALYVDTMAMWEEDNRIADHWRMPTTTYPGYAVAVNTLAADVLARDSDCDWIVTGGDDIFPDPTKRANEIARECTDYFEVMWADARHEANPYGGPYIWWWPRGAKGSATFGVMQPTADRWGENEPWARAQWPDRPAYIDRIAGSPWFGREWCRRAFAGAGPIHPAFRHMHEDECVYEYARMLGVYWERRDLTHFHDHWGRAGDPSAMPDFARQWNTSEHWQESKALLDRLKAEGFASCMPIP